jgi:hypothetical protein
MNGQTWLEIGSIVTTIIVGLILARQIKSQRQLIEQYKGYVEAVNPEKVIKLHERQIEQLNEVNTKIVSQLQTQIIELGTYVDHTLNGYQKIANGFPDEPGLFNRSAVINLNMPSCSGVLASIHEYRKSNTPNP